jgi:hypothetical protein
MIVESDVTPVPAEPGKDFLLEVTIENYGQSEAKNVSIELKPDSSILLKNEDERITYTRLCEFCRITKTYHLHVESQAISGIYEIEIRAIRVPEEIGIVKTISVTVRGEPQLTISDAKIKPEVITPDNNFTLSLLISNKGTGVASAINVKTLLSGLPFIPIGTDSSIIEELQPNSSKRVDYNLLVKNTGEPAPYSIPIRLNYKNENGENRSSEELVGVRVFGKAKLNIANVKTDPVRTKQGEYLSLMITIENSGQGDAKSVKADVDLPFGGTKTAFLGKIEYGEDAPAVFNLQANSAGDYEYKLTLEYEDDLGKHEEVQELEITIYENERNGTILVSFVVIIVVVFIYFTYREWKEEKSIGRAVNRLLKKIGVFFRGLTRKEKKDE